MNPLAPARIPRVEARSGWKLTGPFFVPYQGSFLETPPPTAFSSELSGLALITIS
jgi:hypothetical protein